MSSVSQCLGYVPDVPTRVSCMQQAEKDGYPIYSPYVATDPLSIEDIHVDDGNEGPAWFFVVRSMSLPAMACYL